jgi:phospholipase/carboxylesterase
MPTSSQALLDCIEIESAPNPQAAVIWMHGLGASGDDFAGLYPELNLDGCPAIRFVFPHAPQISVTVNGGYVMPAWYDIFGTELGAGAIKREDAAGISKSQADIEALIAREVSRGIKPEHIVLAGFSQGCAMALHTGLRHKERLAGIMALSGYLPVASTLAAQASDANKTTPIFMAHGVQDPVVVLDRAEASRQILTEQSYSVDWHTYPMPHSVHPREIADISLFLKRVLG